LLTNEVGARRKIWCGFFFRCGCNGNGVTPEWRISDSQQAKFPTQLIRVLNTLSNYLPDGQQLEQCHPLIQPPWQNNLSQQNNRLHISISSEDKDSTARQHKVLFNTINNRDNLILYTDGSELQSGGVGAGVVMMYDGQVVGRWRVGLGLGMKVYDGELVGIARALTEASRTSLSFKHIWIFTDNQAAIINSFRLSTHPGQQVSLQIQQLTKDLLDSDLDLQLHLHWVPGHTGIQGNDEADILAKQAAEYPQPTQDSYLSLTKLKTQIQQSALTAWHHYWTHLPDSKKGRHFRSIHFSLPKLRPSPHFYQLSRHQLATVTQLRLGHGYFKSYLSRMDENIQTSCTCDRQTPAPHTPQHILLDCNKYQQHRHLLKPVAQNFHLPDVLGSKAGLLAVGRFIGKSGAGTRKDYLGSLVEPECSGNGRSGEEDQEREEEEVVEGEGWEEREEERWMEWRQAGGMMEE